MQPIVLFVDDEEGVRKAIRRIFQFQREFDVDFASNGEEALLKLRDREYQVIVSDHLMPGMTGDQLLERVKEEFPDVIRLILTAYGTLDLATHAMNELGVFGFLQKPIKKKELTEILRKAIERYKENNRIQRLNQRYNMNIPPSGLLENLWIIVAKWDEREGPYVVSKCPGELPGIDIDRIAVQTFMGFVLVYGQDGDIEPSQMTIPIHYLKMEARVYFDAMEDQEIRGGQRKFAVIVIAPTMKDHLVDIVDSCMGEFGAKMRKKQNPDPYSLFQNISAKFNVIK